MTFGTRRWWGQPYAPAAFTPRKCSWYSFPLGAESTPGPWNVRKEMCHWKIQWHNRESVPGPSDWECSALTTTLPQAPPGTCSCLNESDGPHYMWSVIVNVFLGLLYTVIVKTKCTKVHSQRSPTCCGQPCCHLQGGKHKDWLRKRLNYCSVRFKLLCVHPLYFISLKMTTPVPVAARPMA
jgi:hypothetical protein